MSMPDKPSYAALERPEISGLIFHPRPEAGFARHRSGEEHLIPVAPDVQVGARFHLTSPGAPNLLFFHGNGEIVADYDELGPLYNRLGINFLPVDYRGYGRSSGQPSIGAMLADSHLILAYVRKWRTDNGFNGPLAVMGRSLGSACALELAAAHGGSLAGLVIESGFAFAGPLLRLLGVDLERVGFREEQGFGNLDKIRGYSGPTLVIHAQHDHIIPLSEGRALYEASPAQQKGFLLIERADHNSIFSVALEKYLQAVQEFMQALQPPR